MIISQTPFRISFFGGGTDYPAYFNEYGGTVLSTTIDKYCYINCRYLPKFFDHKTRLVYSKIETVNIIDEINHPSIRECLRFMNIDRGIEIHHDGDLPARTGLGSSSSFTVGLLNALNALQGKMIDKLKLSHDSIYVEQKLIGENVGCQDQVSVAFGGFNRISFGCNEQIDVQPLTLSPKMISDLESHLVLIFTGVSRIASEVAEQQIKDTPKRICELNEMKSMVDEGIKILLNGTKHLDDFGQLLHESWLLKRSLTSKISNDFIDDIYNEARRSGAIGGKLLGAGGGGFMVFYVKPEKRNRLLDALKKFLYVPFSFESLGSRIIFYRPQSDNV